MKTSLQDDSPGDWGTIVGGEVGALTVSVSFPSPPTSQLDGSVSSQHNYLEKHHSLYLLLIGDPSPGCNLVSGGAEELISKNQSSPARLVVISLSPLWFSDIISYTGVGRSLVILTTTVSQDNQSENDI